MVWSRIQEGATSRPPARFSSGKRQATVFEDLNAWTGGAVNLATADRPEQVDAVRATPGFYSMMGVPFVLGRDFRPEEGQPGSDQVVVLRYRLWDERFGKDPNIVGRDDPDRRQAAHRRRRSGSAASEYREPPQLLIPLAFTPDQINHDFHWLLVMGRLKPGVSLAQANANMTVGGAADRRTLSEVEHGVERERRAAEEQLPAARDADRAVAAPRHRRLRAADCLRQRRQPAARARHGAAARAGGSRVDRRQPRAAVRAAPVRKPGPGASRRRDRRGAVV